MIGRVLSVIGLTCGLALAQRATPVDRQAAAMDYGPTLAATVGVNVENVVPKGLVIKLDKAANANVLFDTELMRVAAGWSGGWLDLKGRVFSGNSDDFPTVMGDVHMRTRVTPGWTSGDKKDDPRRDGPLPREWARFRGHYLHGERVVLSYTVGPCEVLEMPSVIVKDGAVGIARTISMKPNPAAVAVLVGEVSDGKGTVEEGLPVVRNPAGGAMAAGVVGMPAGAQIEISGPRIYLRLPATDKPVRFKLVAGKSAAAVKGMLGGDVEDLEPLTRGGPPRWPQTTTSRGVTDPDEQAYVVDTILLPDDNAYKSWMRPTALDFFPDGKSAAICTWSGDVWVVSNLDNPRLLNLTWRRFATGLNNPMGLKIVDGKVHVMGRDQLTRLHDLNADGEADFYDCLNNDVILTTNFHEFNYDLQTDKEGNFYFSKGSALFTGSQRMTPHHGAICRVSKDGSKFEVLAGGFRAGNGVGVSPTGDVWATDNQGDWVPSCSIVKVKQGGYYGFVGKDQAQPRQPDPPAVWVPFAADKSSAGLTWVAGGKWGPLDGHMLMCSYDTSLFKVYHETVDGVTQGGVARFPVFFSSGLMRGRFSPADGQFYLVGMRGWASRASRDGGFYRVRHTGKPLHVPLNVRAVKGGMEITFDVRLDPESLKDPQNVGVEWFNVQRTANYGSPEYSVTDPTKRGRESVDVKSLQLRGDGKTVFVEIPGLRPVTNLTMRLRLKDATGFAIKQEVHYTIHRVPG